MEYLEEYNRFFKAIINDIKDSIVIIGKKEKEVLFKNQRASNLYEELPVVMKYIINKIIQADGEKQLNIIYDDVCDLCFNIKLFDIFWDNKEAYACIIQKVENKDEQMLQASLFKDTQTELYNRRYCLKRINELLEDKACFIVSFIDMDNLKFVNENYGYEEGNHYIENVVKVFADTFRQTDAVCRFGGDEFIVIMPNCPEELAEKRISEVREKLNNLKKQYSMSFSYGNVLVERDNELSREDILKLADEKMYAFKKRNREKNKS